MFFADLLHLHKKEYQEWTKAVPISSLSTMLGERVGINAVELRKIMPVHNVTLAKAGAEFLKRLDSGFRRNDAHRLTIILEYRKKWKGRQKSCNPVEFGPSQLFSQVSCEVSHFALVRKAISQ